MIIPENQLSSAHNILNTTTYKNIQSNNPNHNNIPKHPLLKLAPVSVQGRYTCTWVDQ